MLHRCPQRHLLCRGSSSVHVKEFECNVCSARVFREGVYSSCNQCGINVCVRCVETFPSDYSFRLRLAGLDIMGTPLLPVYDGSDVMDPSGDLPAAAVYWAYQAWANTNEYRKMLRKEAVRLDAIAEVATRAAREAQMRYVCAQSESDAENSEFIKRCAL